MRLLRPFVQRPILLAMTVVSHARPPSLGRSLVGGLHESCLVKLIILNSARYTGRCGIKSRVIFIEVVDLDIQR